MIKIIMIACLAIILKLFVPPTLLFCIPDSFGLLSLCRSHLLFNLFPFHPRCVCNTTVCCVSQGYSSPRGMLCSSRVNRGIKSNISLPTASYQRTQSFDVHIMGSSKLAFSLKDHTHLPHPHVLCSCGILGFL